MTTELPKENTTLIRHLLSYIKIQVEVKVYVQIQKKAKI